MLGTHKDHVLQYQVNVIIHLCPCFTVFRGWPSHLRMPWSSIYRMLSIDSSSTVAFILATLLCCLTWFKLLCSTALLNFCSGTGPTAQTFLSGLMNTETLYWSKCSSTPATDYLYFVLSPWMCSFLGCLLLFHHHGLWTFQIVMFVHVYINV